MPGPGGRRFAGALLEDKRSIMRETGDGGDDLVDQGRCGEIGGGEMIAEGRRVDSNPSGLPRDQDRLLRSSRASIRRPRIQLGFVHL